MRTLLIAEDEIAFRDDIVAAIDWAANGIRICGVAGNGQEAWSLIEQQAPDLLLTDIRMPGLDGLQLLEQVKQTGLSTQVILLSGFDDFTYAKQALKLGAFDYLLKPCRPEEILAVVGAALRSQQSRQQTDRLAKEHLLCSWMQPSAAAVERSPLAQAYRMAITDSPVHVGLLRCPEALSADVGQRMQAALGPLYGQRLEAFPFGEDWVWIGNVADGFDPDRLRVALQQLREQLRVELGISAYVGVGGVYPGLLALHDSYTESRQALALRDDRPQQAIFLWDEVASASADTDAAGALVDPEMTQREAEILQHMQSGRYAQAIDATELWLDHLRQHPEYPRRQVHLRAVALLLGLQRTTQVQSIPAIRWKEELIQGINLLPTVETIDELHTIMTKYLQHLVSILTSRRPLHRTVEAVLKIVAAQYPTNLTLEAVAKEVFVSSSYLSTLFKQEMGINFLDYLHQYRIERAKELLSREPLKIFAAAKLVGYQDERHFSNTFKRWTGISPSQFQKSVGQ